MPLWSTLDDPIRVIDLTYNLPEKKSLAEVYGLVGDHVNYKGESEATVQMVFFSKYKIQVPDDQIHDSDVLQSPSYAALKLNFYEIIKNSVDSKASTLDLAIYKNKSGEIEIVVGDKEGAGFRAGKYASHFISSATLVNFDNLAQGAHKLQSEKKKGTSLGGAGKGLMFINQRLKLAGGSLLLQSTADYSAILRLKSKVAANIKELTMQAATEDEDFSPVDMLNKIKLVSARANHSHFTFVSSSSQGDARVAESSPKLKKKSKSEKETQHLCCGINLNCLFSPASTTDEEIDDDDELSEGLQKSLMSPTA